eukprot:gnl/TRDRNA2_/TRDRNA2_157538_c1_seq1.p1 gnl/TRDRNA2_/TRDRNA2_157538_c1~~gnl/TRDRNA2_/TRDRNA2_157538_c1_seq1.p1  ORF type:complete len:344 (+),score=59.51 gnl/TRDRNA2_/TRDRNA2_157538_c1_seq1:53-1033(+)
MAPVIAGCDEQQVEADIATRPVSGTPPASAVEVVAVVREHVAAVQAELAWFQRSFEESRASGESPQLRQDLQELLCTRDELEVSRNTAVARAETLASEKQSLLEIQARLESELRSQRQRLEEVRRYLRHKEIHLQEITGRTPIAIPYAEPSSMSSADPGLGDDADMLGCGVPTFDDSMLASSELHLVATLGDMSIGKQSRSQAIKALRTCQKELYSEQKLKERLEKRILKDREQLQKLMEISERRREEIRELNKRCTKAELISGAFTEALSGHLPRKGVKEAILHATRAKVGKSGSQPFGGAADDAMPSLSRKQPAPNVFSRLMAS